LGEIMSKNIMRQFIFVWLLWLGGCISPENTEGNLQLKNLFSANINGWQAEGEVEIYDRESIFRYMDGAGEIYRMYDYRGMQVLRMINNAEPEIKIELFDMGTPEDAFGVFSHMREDDEAGIGEGSEYRKGLLCFWQGKYFICLIADEETPTVKEAIFLMAGIIADSIKISHAKPAILSLLPEDNLKINTVRYFNLQSSLNYHYFVSQKNILNLDGETEAVLAQYIGECYLLCINYPNADKSARAYSSFMSNYLPEAAGAGAFEISESKWVSAEMVREYIIIVFDAPDRQFSEELVKSTKRKI